MKKILIKLYLFSLTLQIITFKNPQNDRTLIKGLKKEDRKKCDFLFKSIFIKQEGEMMDIYGNEPSYELRSFCPGIEKTCCSTEELNTQFKTAVKTIKIKNKLKEAASFQKFFLNIKEKDLQNFIEKNDLKIDNCLIDILKPSDFLNFIVNAKENYSKLYEKYKLYIIEISKDILRANCGICDKKNASYFNFSEGKQKENYQLTVDRKEILNYFINQEHYNYFLPLYHIQKVLNCYLYDLGDKVDLNKKTVLEEALEFLQNDDYESLLANPKTKKFFSNYYIPGGLSDIFFDELTKLYKNTFYDKGIEDGISYRAFSEWTPFEIDKESSFPAFTVDSTSIKIGNEGYNSDKNKIGKNMYWQALRQDIINFTYEKALEYKIPDDEDEEEELEENNDIFGAFLFCLVFILI